MAFVTVVASLLLQSAWALSVQQHAQASHSQAASLAGPGDMSVGAGTATSTDVDAKLAQLREAQARMEPMAAKQDSFLQEQRELFHVANQTLDSLRAPLFKLQVAEEEAFDALRAVRDPPLTEELRMFDGMSEEEATAAKAKIARQVQQLEAVLEEKTRAVNEVKAKIDVLKADMSRATAEKERLISEYYNAEWNATRAEVRRAERALLSAEAEALQAEVPRARAALAEAHAEKDAAAPKVFHEINGGDVVGAQTPLERKKALQAKHEWDVCKTRIVELGEQEEQAAPEPEQQRAHWDPDVSTWEQRGMPGLEQTCGAFAGEAWKAIAKLNQEGREALARGEGRDVVVWECLSENQCGGLGDQLRGLLRSFYWAAAKGSLFYVNWYRYESGMERLLAPNQIDWRVPMDDKGKASLEPCKKGKNTTVITSFVGHAEETWSSDAACTKIRTNAHLRQEHAEAAHVGLYGVGCAFHFLFRPTALLSKLAAQLHPPGILSGRFVAVHLRVREVDAAKPLAEQSPGNRSVLESRLVNMLKIASDNATNLGEGGRPLPIMLYTDSLTAKELVGVPAWLRDRGLPEAVFTTLGADGRPFTPLHSGGRFDRKAREADGEDATLFQLAGLRGVNEAWADLFGMAHSVALVRTASSMLSRAAVDIGMFDAANVVEVHPQGNVQVGFLYGW